MQNKLLTVYWSDPLVSVLSPVLIIKCKLITQQPRVFILPTRYNSFFCSPLSQCLYLLQYLIGITIFILINFAILHHIAQLFFTLGSDFCAECYRLNSNNFICLCSWHTLSPEWMQNLITIRNPNILPRWSNWMYRRSRHVLRILSSCYCIQSLKDNFLILHL